MSFVWAFLFGGLLCLPAQILLDKTMLSPARILVGYVIGGVILGAIGWYEPFVSLAGAGATTPLCGFGSVIVKGVRAAVDEKGALGIGVGALTAASFGTTAALVFGFLAAILSRGKPK